MKLLNLSLLLLLATIANGQDDTSDRLDCVLVEGSLTEEECLKRGCHWKIDSRAHYPWCYLDKKTVGYTSSTPIIDANGLESTLTIKSEARKSAPFTEIGQLKFQATYVSKDILRLRITDPAHKRYEVPIVETEFNIPTATPTSTNYNVSLSGDFNLVVTRKGTNIKLIDTSIGGLIYSDLFIQFATYLASEDVYGFGENYHLSFKRDMKYSTLPIYARDHGVGDQGINYYGHHPFWTVVEADGKAHGMFLLNSNAMAYTLMPHPAVSLKTTGGIIDLLLFVGDNPEHVVQLYTSVIGRPVMPPFWGMGFQQCRWGYKNTQDMAKVLNRTLAHNVPLDIFYMDIDWMDEYRDFTYSKKNFPDLPKFIEDTKKEHNLRWTLILDPAIQADHPGYFVFDEGYKEDVFIKWPKNLANSTQIGHPKNVPTDKGVLYGKVWPNGPAAFPDFFKTSTQKWWKRMIKHLHDELKFDALWIDMNEPSNFDDYKDYKCPADKYTFTHPQMHLDVPESSKTVCASALQGEHDEFVHYDVHSLYGWSESRPTMEGIHESTGKRGFVVSRSTFPSSGKYTAHWLGDNNASWEQLRHSIIGMLEFNLFGIAFVGVDICGFGGRPTPELCKRWFQLGAYYPFSRSHNTIGEQDQDPGWFADNGHPEVTKAAELALKTRYQLLHYLYTRFYLAQVYGETVARPLHHEFPHDKPSRSIDTQFLWGHSIMIAPFLHEAQTEVKAHVPANSDWFKFALDFVEEIKPSGDNTITIPDSESYRPVLIRAGTILPIVGPETLPKVVNTANLRKVPIELWILPDSNGTAKGDLFFDDGESINTVGSGHYNFYRFELSNCHLVIEPVHIGYQSQPGSHDILQVKTLQFALGGIGSQKITHEDLEITPDSHFSLKDYTLVHNTMKLNLEKPIDLLTIKDRVYLSFKNKKTNECFTH